MTNIEKGYFLRLFNRSGNIPGFNVNEFNAFTMGSIGRPLCEYYGLSKGKSLTRFIYEEGDVETTKLLLDLLAHYEENYPYFHHETGYGDENELAPIWGQINNSKEPEYKKLYEKCKEVANRIASDDQFTHEAVKNIQEAFSSEYIDKQIHLMMSMMNENPTEAIGKAKELIESCCKAILEENAQQYDKNWDVPKLVGTTMDYLKITPNHINEEVKEAKSIKSILGSLRAIATGISELRNSYGSGHGKSPNYKGLEDRHARLAVGASFTLVQFLWDSHKRVKSQQEQ